MHHPVEDYSLSQIARFYVLGHSVFDSGFHLHQSNSVCKPTIVV